MNDDIKACQIPDDKLSPEELAKRKEWEAYHAKEDSYDNSWKKNEENGYNCNFKRRIADSNTDFSNLKIQFLDWDFHLRIGEAWQVISIPGFPHEYDNTYYCYPLKLGKNPNDFKHGLIPFDKDWNIIKWDMQIEEYTGFKYKWDEIRHRQGVIGNLLRNGEVFHKVTCNSHADAFAHLLTAITDAQNHIANFASRDWKKNIIGHKVWYEGTPCIISGVNEYDGVSFRISPDNTEKSISPPKHWDDDKDGICSKSRWYENEYHQGCSVEWNSSSIKYFRKDKNE